MKNKIYIISGDPVALARCRYNPRNHKVWDSQKEQKVYSSLSLRSQHKDTPLFEGPLCMDINFFMEIPKKHKKADIAGNPHIFKPDIDNLIKFVLDCCNKILYNDDCTITKITASKVYDDNPRTEFTIESLL